MDTYADDVATLVEGLDLRNAIHVGHSTDGGEVARYLGRHGTQRVAKAVLIGAVPPLMLKTAANPGGLPMEAFDGIRAGGRLETHARYYWLLLAEGHLTRQVFGAILRRIWALPAPAG